MKDKIMPKFTTSTNAHPSQIVRNAAETVEGWAELVKAIEEHIELYPDVLRPDRELQLARANKKLEAANSELQRENKELEEAIAKKDITIEWFNEQYLKAREVLNGY